jgi:hypothetical protein
LRVLARGVADCHTTGRLYAGTRDRHARELARQGRGRARIGPGIGAGEELEVVAIAHCRLTEQRLGRVEQRRAWLVLPPPVMRTNLT